MTKKHICDRCEENMAEEYTILSSLKGYQHLCSTCIYDESFLKCTSCHRYVDWLAIQDIAYLQYILGHNRIEQEFICPPCCKTHKPDYPEHHLYSLDTVALDIYFNYDPSTLDELADMESNPTKYLKKTIN